MKPIHRRPAAIEDMIRQVAYRRDAAGEAFAAALIDEMQESLRSISEAPAIGSRRIGQLLGIPALQWKRVGNTKFWLWYVEEARPVDVIRLISTDRLPRQVMLPNELH